MTFTLRCCSPPHTDCPVVLLWFADRQTLDWPSSSSTRDRLSLPRARRCATSHPRDRGECSVPCHHTAGLLSLPAGQPRDPTHTTPPSRGLWRVVGRAAAAAAGLLCLCCSIGLAFRCSSTDVVWDDRITASLRGWRAVLGALSLSHGPTATHPSRVLPCWSHDDDAAVALRPVVPFGVACGVGSPLFGCYPPPWAGWLPLLRLAGWPTTHSRALAARLLSAGRSSSSVGGQTGTGCIGSPAASHARTHGTRTHNPAASAALPLRTGRRFVRLAAAVPCRGVWRGVRRALPGGGGGGGGLPRGEIAHTLTHPSHHPLTALSLSSLAVGAAGPCCLLLTAAALSAGSLLCSHPLSSWLLLPGLSLPWL